MVADPNLLRLLDKLVPQKDGEPYTVHRTALVAAVNSDGTVDLTLSGVTVPDVPVLGGGVALVGAVVSVLVWQGALLVLGAVAATDQRAPVRQWFTSSGTWTKPAGLSHIHVQMWGGGGGGGGSPTCSAGQASAGSGGGGGGYVEALIDAASLSSSEGVVIGTGGSGGVGVSGSSGGNTTFDGMTAAGGTGGVTLAASAAQGSSYGGAAGGTASGGNIINLQGRRAQQGLRTSNGTAATLNGLLGGDAPNGGSGGVGTTNGNGGTGSTPGGGGGGTGNTAAAVRTGGTGGDGMVIIIEHYA